MNETEITPKSSLYSYQAYLETLLSYGSDYKKGQVKAGGFYRVKNKTDQSDQGYAGQRALSTGGAQFELMGRPHWE